MEMNKMKRLVLLLIVLLGTTGVRAQLGEAVKKIFAGDSVTTVHNTPLNRFRLCLCGQSAKNPSKQPGSTRRICVWKWSR